MASWLPFHAAGSHSSGSTENAFSRVVSSYTASIKALAYAQRRAEASRNLPGSFMTVTMPTSPANADGGKLPSLHGVMEEEKKIERLAAFYLPQVQRVSLKLPDVSAVVKELRDCSIAHFACHGSADPSDPSSSRLIFQIQDDQGLRQDHLTVQIVSKLTLPAARLAYLSACSTGQNRVWTLSDEVLHVVSAFQVAGFPHVVGSLWLTSDFICEQVAEVFYESLFQRQNELGWTNYGVAQALQKAVMAVCGQAREAPLLWAQFIHFGA